MVQESIARGRVLKLGVALLAAGSARLLGGAEETEMAWLVSRAALFVQVVVVAGLSMLTLQRISSLPPSEERTKALDTLKNAARTRTLAAALIASAHARQRAPPALLAGASALAVGRAFLHPLTQAFVLRPMHCTPAPKSEGEGGKLIFSDTDGKKSK